MGDNQENVSDAQPLRNNLRSEYKMCKKKQFKYCSYKIDSCLNKILLLLNISGIKTLGSCCGHKKYHITIVWKRGELNTEMFSGITINRRKKFYEKDSKGYYFIPEVEEYWKANAKM